MDGKQMITALSYIDDDLIAEAEQKKSFKRRTHPAGWFALAASLVIVVAAAITVPKLMPPAIQPENTPGILPGASQTRTESQPMDEAVPGGEESNKSIQISRSNIHLNGAELLDGAPLYYNPALYDRVEWDIADIADYFGRDLAVPYLPDGIPPSDNGSTEVYRKKSDGAIVYDTFEQVYGTISEEASESGGVILPKGFTLTASKLGILSDCICVIPGEDKIRTSEIAGADVTIGYREMHYGPYDPETHTPAGTYPLYVFQFALDGVEYDITTHNLPLDEAVKIAASFIAGNSSIEITD